MPGPNAAILASPATDEERPSGGPSAAGRSITHGARDLPGVAVDSYNLELRDGGGFVGDQASGRTFNAILDEWRDRLRVAGGDPLAGTDSRDAHDDVLMTGDSEAAGLMQAAMSEFALALADVTRRFLEHPAWRGTQRIVVGGGVRQERVGEIIIGHAAAILNREGLSVEFRPIRAHPDEAGLIGASYLVEPDRLRDAHALLTVDIGGTNIRAGLVEPARLGRPDAGARLILSTLRRHAEDDHRRDALVARMVTELAQLASEAEAQGMRLAPIVAVGCPGLIRPDGGIERGAQNLPGNWDKADFNLPREIEARMAEAGRRGVEVYLHNDAVVQGLSELPFTRDVERWAVLTIGTGLGNARFTRTWS